MRSTRSGNSADARLPGVLAAIYAAATDDARWVDALAGVTELLQGNGGLIFSHEATPERRGLWVPYRPDPLGMQRYVEHYHAHDVWLQIGEARGVFVPGNVVVGDDLLPRRDFLASVFFREFLETQDIHDVCGGMLHDGREPGVPRIHVSVYRSLSKPPFAEREKAAMRMLIPHLQEATRIAFRLAEAGQRLAILQAATDTVAPALLLADDAGSIVFANRPAQRLLEKGDGLWLESGRLQTTIRAERGALQALLKPAGGAEGMLRVTRPSGRPSYWVVRIGLPAVRETPPDAQRPGVALMIHDPACFDELNVDDFAATHELSRAEKKLLVNLLAHPTLPEAARHIEVSVNTVRTQLRSILAKTGARRQVELIRMLMTWPRKGV